MKQLLIIPKQDELKEYLSVAEEYKLGFEYNDFFLPDLLDDEEKLKDVIAKYKACELPKYTTLHGAFFDVIPFSADKRIREISDRRIRQSIEIAKELGAKAVIFHTNYNPFLNSSAYVKSWLQSNAEYWGGILKEYPDINIYLENMFDTTPDLMVALSEQLCGYGNYGVCLDYAHASLSDAEPAVWAERLGKYVKHIHINDNDLVSDLHLAWGDGKINRESFYRCYERHMQEATVLIETSTMENVKKSLEMLKKEKFI